MSFHEFILIYTPWPESVSELYRPSDRRLSAKLVPTFTDREMSRSQRGGFPTASLARKLKKHNNLLGNRTCDVLACRIASQLTTTKKYCQKIVMSRRTPECSVRLATFSSEFPLN
jgi:hypothetical protein